MPKLPGLRRLRDLAALSQDDLARKAGLARTTLLRIERLETNARPSTVRKIAAALGCTPADLIHDE